MTIGFIGNVTLGLGFLQQPTHPKLQDCSSRVAIGGSIHKDGLDWYDNPRINHGFSPLHCWGGGRGRVTSSNEVPAKG